MEWKSVPKPLETKIDLVTEIDRQAKTLVKTSCNRYGLKICYGSLLLVVLAYCIYLHYSQLQVIGKLKQLESSSISPDTKETLIDKDLERRHGEERRRRHQRANRDRRIRQQIRDLWSRPLVHLTGKENARTHPTEPVYTSGIAICSNDEQCFLWDEPDEIYSSFGYGSDVGFDFVRRDSVVGVKIKMAGVYDIYSQLCVAGLIDDNQLPSIPWFGYETIKIQHYGHTRADVTVLGSTFATQDDRGQKYTLSNGASTRPVDTLNQRGMFMLHCNDVIMIRLATQLSIGDISFLQDKKRTYFGLTLVRRLSLTQPC